MFHRLASGPVQDLRLRAGFNSAKEVAKLAGCSRIHLSGFERGAIGASAALKARLAELYGCSVERLDTASNEARRAFAERMYIHAMNITEENQP